MLCLIEMLQLHIVSDTAGTRLFAVWSLQLPRRTWPTDAESLSLISQGARGGLRRTKQGQGASARRVQCSGMSRMFV